MSELVIFGSCQLQRETRILFGPNGSRRLSERSCEVLGLLLSRPNKVISNSDLITAVWPDMMVKDIKLQTCISVLRKALPTGMILTVLNRGYTYVGPSPVVAEECCGSVNS